MTDSPSSAPAGWYDDPHMPERMRYFDGQEWTNHFHNPGQLPDIGGWLNNTFSVFAKYWPGAAMIALVASLVGNLVVWSALRSTTDDLVVIDEELRNFTATKGVVLALVVLFGIVWQGLGWIALNRFMQRAHFQAAPTVTEAVAHAFRRLPKFLGVAFALGALLVLVSVIVAVLTVAAPVLGIFAILLLLSGLVWAFVKLSFLMAAIAAAPGDAGVLRASADVSAGRFWGIAGRLIAFVFALGLIGNIVTLALGDFGSVIDSEAMTNTFRMSGSELVVDDFRIAELFPASGTFLIAVVATSLLSAATTMISTSAFMRLYLDVGGPSEI